MKTIVLGLIVSFALTFGLSAQAQQALPCQVRLAINQYQLKNDRDAGSPENLDFDTPPPAENLEEAARRSRICVVPGSEHSDYTFVWEKTKKGFKGELLQAVGGQFKTVAHAEEETANELVQIIFDAAVMHSTGLASDLLSRLTIRKARIR